MGQAYLIIQELYGEVGAVAVCHSDHVFQRVAEALFKHFGTTPGAAEHERQIRCLRYP